LGIQLRSSSFWRNIKFRVVDGKEEIITDNLTGEPHYLCSDDGCILSGATVHLQFPAAAFTSESATVEISPPEGEQVAVDFDLSSLR
jgi:hypothetical protein